MRTHLLTLLTTALLATPSWGQLAPPSNTGAPRSTNKIVRSENCLVVFKNKVDVAARAEGTLTELNFEEGTTVNENDVMAVIDDTSARLTLELKAAEKKEAELNSENDVNYRDAVNSEALAKAEAEAFKQMFSQRAITKWEMEKKVLEAVRMQLRIDLAKLNLDIAAAQKDAKTSEYKLAEFEITRRQIKAPFTGYIESRIVQKGEWVQPGSPVARLIQIDKLRVQGDFRPEYQGQIRIGTPVSVLIYTQGRPAVSDLPLSKALEVPGVEVIEGQLGYVSMNVRAQNKYPVWVELDNRRVGDDWLIKPGMQAEIIIGQLP